MLELAAPAQSDWIDQFFGPTGPLAKKRKGYQPRQPQIDIARKVDNALRKGEHALIEGPCGTGKSYAYGVPASKYAAEFGVRVVIATATNGLLDQLAWGKDSDLAELQTIVDWKFRFARLKGRSNYMCPWKMAEAEDPIFPDDRKKLRRLQVWGQQTQTGDKTECPPEAMDLWSMISVSPEECTKPACDYLDECPAELARRAANNANVIVTNHTLLALELRHGGKGRAILPPFDRLIIDEAHELPDWIRRAYGDSIHRYSWKKIWAFGYAQEQQKLLQDGVTKRAVEATQAMFEQAKGLLNDPFSAMAAEFGAAVTEKRKNIPSPSPFELKEIRASLDAIQGRAKKIQEEAANEENRINPKEEKAAREVDRTIQKANATLGMLQDKEGNIALWLEQGSNGEAEICAQPVDVGKLLQENLYKAHPGTIFLSATLSTGGTFDFFRREMGVPKETTDLCVDSPFDFRSRSLLLLPEGLKDPKEGDPWFLQVLQTLKSAVDAADGRTLGLFTSKSRAVEAAKWLRQRDRTRTILLQGEQGSAKQLAEAFKKDPRSVLLGTRTFWTGLDVPGESLEVVLIDRLPIPSPDALLDAMKARMGDSYFNSYLYPKAALVFKQGAGRLIRTVKDRGVLIVCDPRIRTASYGGVFLKSLPPMPQSRAVKDISLFFQTVARLA